jgi:hypothetical protein
MSRAAAFSRMSAEIGSRFSAEIMRKKDEAAADLG